jgi:hypothetical protein
MAIENMENKNFKKAEELFGTAENIRKDYRNEQTTVGYRLIVKNL